MHEYIIHINMQLNSDIRLFFVSTFVYTSHNSALWKNSHKQNMQHLHCCREKTVSVFRLLLREMLLQKFPGSKQSMKQSSAENVKLPDRENIATGTFFFKLPTSGENCLQTANPLFPNSRLSVVLSFVLT